MYANICKVKKHRICGKGSSSPGTDNSAPEVPGRDLSLSHHTPSPCLPPPCSSSTAPRETGAPTLKSLAKNDSLTFWKKKKKKVYLPSHWKLHERELGSVSHFTNQHAVVNWQAEILVLGWRVRRHSFRKTQLQPITNKTKHVNTGQLLPCWFHAQLITSWNISLFSFSLSYPPVGLWSDPIGWWCTEGCLPSSAVPPWRDPPLPQANGKTPLGWTPVMKEENTWNAKGTDDT